MPDFDASKTWMGIGLKTGGTLFVVGMENTEGRMFNLQNANIRYDFSILSARLGLGLGGGTGLCAVCVFNCDNPIVRLHNTETTDWGVNVPLRRKWSKIAKTLKNSRFFVRVTRVGARLSRLVPAEVEAFRNDLHYLYTAFDVASSSGPKLVTIDTPAGVGLELSANYTIGRLEVY
ncbi:MAG TPA: hypothetical protein DEP46_01545 [Blastocatellia bacterium]|nr:hypothetical protein [Blastocatellia bacterium]